MITVSVYNQSNFPIKASEVKRVVKKTLEENGMVSDCEVEVALVSESKMDELNKEYYKDEEYIHPVFTFPETEGQFVFPPDGKIHLGEIVISYQAVVDRAKEGGKLIDEVVKELVQHGTQHLVGIHHD